MTYGEAIRYAKCLHYPCVPNDDEFAELVNQAKTMAIEALEKQIPKKPIKSETENKCWCPSCDDEDEMDIYGTEYCPYCGQALDWSEENV